MREPAPDLSAETVRTSLREQYGISSSEVIFLPLGYDSSAWVYRVQTDDGTPYFLKARLSVTNEAGLLLPRYLHDRGVTRVVAPLPTTTGALWTNAGGYALILYPFIAGTSGWGQGLSEQQWIDYGRILRQIHETPIAADLRSVMGHESFAPGWAGVAMAVDAHVGGRVFDDPARRELAAAWRARREVIRTLLRRAEELGQRFKQTAPPLVICHADAHTGNVLLDTGGQVWIVDWDETVLAPRERDLMFVMGGGIGHVGAQEEQLFCRGYGETAVDPLALSYYRHAWAVGDIAAFSEEVFFRPDLGAETRRAAVKSFLGLFEPGQIVDLALAAAGMGRRGHDE